MWNSDCFYWCLTISRFDRDWKKIEAFVGSKTAIQIRSHAQKYFLKVQKSGANEHVPPPRPKRKAAHPYPHKAPKNGRILIHLIFKKLLSMMNFTFYVLSVCIQKEEFHNLLVKTSYWESHICGLQMAVCLPGHIMMWQHKVWNWNRNCNPFVFTYYDDCWKKTNLVRFPTFFFFFFGGCRWCEIIA